MHLNKTRGLAYANTTPSGKPSAAASSIQTQLQSSLRLPWLGATLPATCVDAAAAVAVQRSPQA